MLMLLNVNETNYRKSGNKRSANSPLVLIKFFIDLNLLMTVTSERKRLAIKVN